MQHKKTKLWKLEKENRKDLKYVQKRFKSRVEIVTKAVFKVREDFNPSKGSYKSQIE